MFCTRAVELKNTVLEEALNVSAEASNLYRDGSNTCLCRLSIKPRFSLFFLLINDSPARISSFVVTSQLHTTFPMSLVHLNGLMARQFVRSNETNVFSDFRREMFLAQKRSLRSPTVWSRILKNS